MFMVFKCNISHVYLPRFPYQLLLDTFNCLRLQAYQIEENRKN